MAEHQDAVLNQLMQAYRDSFAEKLETLRRGATEAAQGGWQPAALANLANSIHRLAGSSGAYGYAELHAKAASLDQRLKTIRSDEANHLDPDQISELERQLEDLFECIAAQMSE